MRIRLPASVLACVALIFVSFADAQDALQYVKDGDAAYLAKDYAKASQSYIQAIKLDPESPELYERLGHVYQDQHNQRFTLAFKKADELRARRNAVGNQAATVAPSAAPLKPVAGPGGAHLQGLYLQLQPSGTAFVYVHYYFWPDGRMCNGLPSGGLDAEPVDFASIQKQKKCGHYRITSNRMSLQWQDEPAPHDVSLVNVRADGFEMNGYNTAKMPSFGSGLSLNGSYSATQVGQQMRKQTYTFGNDGAYQLNDRPVTSRDGAAKSDHGTYRLSNNDLELTGAAGSLRLTAYPFPNGGIMIEGAVFHKD